MKNNFVITMLLASASLYAANEATTSSSCPTASSSITITKDGRDLTFDPVILNQSVTYQHMIEDVQMDAAAQASWAEQVVEDLTVEQAQALFYALSLNNNDVLMDYLNKLTPADLMVIVHKAGYLDVQNLYNQAIKKIAHKIKASLISQRLIDELSSYYVQDVAKAYYITYKDLPEWLKPYFKGIEMQDIIDFADFGEIGSDVTLNLSDLNLKNLDGLE